VLTEVTSGVSTERSALPCLLDDSTRTSGVNPLALLAKFERHVIQERTQADLPEACRKIWSSGSRLSTRCRSGR
jgi:hypothetical protein